MSRGHFQLELYREHAKIEMSKPVLIRKDLWTFWTFNALILPNFFAVASTVALISPSSAVYERLFARLVMGFGDDQENAPQDYKSASTIMRFNNSLMKSSGLVPYWIIFIIFDIFIIFWSYFVAVFISIILRISIILILLRFTLFHFWWLITAISVEYRYGDFWAFFQAILWVFFLKDFLTEMTIDKLTADSIRRTVTFMYST